MYFSPYQSVCVCTVITHSQSSVVILCLGTTRRDADFTGHKWTQKEGFFVFKEPQVILLCICGWKPWIENPAEEVICLGLEQCLQPAEFAPQETVGMSGNILGYHSCGKVVLLAYSRQRPGMPLLILVCTGQHPPLHHHHPQQRMIWSKVSVRLRKPGWEERERKIAQPFCMVCCSSWAEDGESSLCNTPECLSAPPPAALLRTTADPRGEISFTCPDQVRTPEHSHSVFSFHISAVTRYFFPYFLKHKPSSYTF